MKSPSPLDYIVGNPISALLIVIATLFVVLAAIGGSATPIAAFSMLALCGWAWSSNRRVETYRLWKREWDAMSGKVKPAKAPRKPFRFPKMKGAPAKPAADRDLVSVMVPMPRRSPTIMDAYNVLPRYCERVIRGG
ncbi:MAG: hypothetical protein CGW95_09790 [Phenylobacterium zucineum]|nr:MAG: hypothetical protein CGW95_09790 [Phenylobacterium zucineum]